MDETELRSRWLAANEVQTIIQEGHGPTPTPVISQAILVQNLLGPNILADSIVTTPSHNPPEDGGFKYNPPWRTGQYRRNAIAREPSQTNPAQPEAVH